MNVLLALAVLDFAPVADTVYEHQWMQGGNEQWVYPAEFMASLSDEQKMYFNSYAFDPPFFGSTTDGNLKALLKKGREEEAGGEGQG